MAIALANRVKLTVSGTPGTGTITLGNAVPGFNSLTAEAAINASIVSGATVAYFAEDTESGSAVFETGHGVITLSGSTWSLTRNVDISSSGAGVALSLTSAALVGVTFLAGDWWSNNGGFVNKFRNGNFDIWQRGTASTSISTSGATFADGWIISPGGAAVTAAQDASRANPDNTLALKITGASGNTSLAILQRIESFIAAVLAGQVCTVKFKIFNDTGAAITPVLTVGHASAVDNFTTVDTDIAAQSLQSCPNNAWTTVAFTFTAAANSINGMQVTLSFGALGAGASVEVTAADIRLTPFVPSGELNFAPPTPEFRPIGAELALCQRYFSKSFPQGTPPANNTAAAYNGIATGDGSSVASQFIHWPQTMRATPTVTFFSPTTASPVNGEWEAGATATSAATAVESSSDTGMQVAVAVSLAAGSSSFVTGNWTASAEL